MDMMLSEEKKNLWRCAIEPIRHSIDLSTVILFWMMVTNSEDWETICELIVLVMGKDIDDSLAGDTIGNRAIYNWPVMLTDKKISSEESIDLDVYAARMTDYESKLHHVSPRTNYDLNQFYTDESGYYGDEGASQLDRVSFNVALNTRFIDLDLLLARLPKDHQMIYEMRSVGQRDDDMQINYFPNKKLKLAHCIYSLLWGTEQAKTESEALKVDCRKQLVKEKLLTIKKGEKDQYEFEGFIFGNDMLNKLYDVSRPEEKLRSGPKGNSK